MSRRTSIEEMRRSELVLAALVVIARQGFDRTTVRDIALEAGASVGSVHYYYKTKDDLLYAAFEESERRTVVRLDEIDRAARSARDWLERLADLCFSPGDPEDAQWTIEIDVWQQAARHESFRELFARGNRTWVARIAGALERGADDGEFAPLDDVEAEAASLAALIDGLGVYTRVTRHLDVARARELLRRRVDSLAA